MALGPQVHVRRERQGSVLGEGDSGRGAELKGAGGLEGLAAWHTISPSIPEVSDVVGGPGRAGPSSAYG